MGQVTDGILKASRSVVITSIRLYFTDNYLKQINV